MRLILSPLPGALLAALLLVACGSNDDVTPVDTSDDSQAASPGIDDDGETEFQDGVQSTLIATGPDPSDDSQAASPGIDDDGETGFQDGVQSTLIATGLGGDVLRRCFADATVDVLGDQIVEIIRAGDNFELAKDEQLFDEDGKRVDTGPTLVNLPVYRDESGTLVVGWTKCEDITNDAVPAGDGLPLPAPIP